MIDALQDFYKAISIIDLIFLLFTIWSVIKCYSKGFVLSLLSVSKWILAYVITLLVFPRIKPYFKNIIEYEELLVASKTALEERELALNASAASRITTVRSDTI